MTIRRGPLGLRAYLVTSAFVFVTATSVTDVLARMEFSATSLESAIVAHFKYTGIIHYIALIAPFLLVSLICWRLDRFTRHRISLPIFFLSICVLGYFYAGGFWGTQAALHQGRWTAASLSVGLLPFIGLAIVFGSACLAALASMLDRRRPHE